MKGNLRGYVSIKFEGIAGTAVYIVVVGDF